jgi:hypothetical protein
VLSSEGLQIGAPLAALVSPVTTLAVTALDPSQSSLAGGIVDVCQVAGGAVGLGINTAIVESADDLSASVGPSWSTPPSR